MSHGVWVVRVVDKSLHMYKGLEGLGLGLGLGFGALWVMRGEVVSGHVLAGGGGGDTVWFL